MLFGCSDCELIVTLPFTDPDPGYVEVRIRENDAQESTASRIIALPLLPEVTSRVTSAKNGRTPFLRSSCFSLSYKDSCPEGDRPSARELPVRSLRAGALAAASFLGCYPSLSLGARALAPSAQVARKRLYVLASGEPRHKPPRAYRETSPLFRAGLLSAQRGT